MLDLAIVGGGPGGLMSAWYLKKKLGDLCRITLYEASDRVGGKVVTRQFDTAIEAFRKRCSELVSPAEYYEGVGAHDNEHPWAYKSCEEVLDEEVEDATAKRFFKVMARSGLATEAHNTNGLNALKNFVMDIDGYIGLYSIQNGNEQLIDCLRSEVQADIRLNHRVLKVGKTESGRYQLNMMNGKGPETRDFDLVVMCLPHSWLAPMRWDTEQFGKSMV